VRRGALAFLAASILAAGAVRAQQAGELPRASPRLTIRLARDSSGRLQPPVVTAQHLMADGMFEGSLRNGFPVRFQFRLGAWRDAWPFDKAAGEISWDVLVILDPVTNTYQVLRSPDSTLTTLPDLRSLDSALAVPFTVDLVPRGRRNERYYFVADLDAESLSISELEEVERWLRGDLGRALTQRGDVGNAFSRGARLALIRLSGLPHRSLQAKTARFQP
jgi:hypothetical protein